LGDKEGDEHDLEPVISFADAHIAYDTVTSLLGIQYCWR
jgi:hypothetical protein